MKLYVLVCKNLNEKQKWVQGAHAVAQYVIENPGRWENGTLVMLESPDILKDAESSDSVFREPYYDNRITAIAKLGKSRLYSGYNLL